VNAGDAKLIVVVGWLVCASVVQAQDVSTIPASVEAQAAGNYDIGLSAYDPVYFIAGNNGKETAKFQVSFKYQVFHSEGWFSRNLRAPTGLYLAYTQTSLWDLDELSSPFRDTSYRPRVFYLRESDRNRGRHWLWDFEGGFVHESNGKADPESRGYNALYVKPTLSYYLNATRRFYVAPQVNSYTKETENPDIADYRGHVDLTLGYGSGNRNQNDWSAWTTIRRGDVSGRGSVEFNVAAPLRRLSGDRINGWILMQYFNGYGESLIDYNVSHNAQFRIGIGLLVQ
jgi:phospholipase A1